MGSSRLSRVETARRYSPERRSPRRSGVRRRGRADTVDHEPETPRLGVQLLAFIAIGHAAVIHPGIVSPRDRIWDRKLTDLPTATPSRVQSTADSQSTAVTPVPVTLPLDTQAVVHSGGNVIVTTVPLGSLSAISIVPPDTRTTQYTKRRPSPEP